ncbi:hypothetical protein [uncultured Paludibaculum sp.]|uniref:hypothetical protein n=1 Tax=uncultured Paludibaculum sp. TaxID=1765020 RepID=UPI002AAAA15B|nr:hypothetical protein [uncultured Paludibaculum sp.]
MLQRLKARLREHEGVIPHLYLDTLGLVTCGVGHLVALPEHLDAVAMCKPDGSTATQAEKRAEWHTVKGLSPAKLPSYYEQRTVLRMTPDAISALQDSDVNGFRTALTARLPGFQEFPEPVQEALLDMAFQLGVSGLCRQFPRLVLAIKTRDWATCAAQCHRAGIQEWRNAATADLFMQAVAA